MNEHSFLFFSFNLAYVLLVSPVCVVVLHHGLHQKCSSMSHSDCFTYQLSSMELFGIFGCTLNICGIFTKHLSILMWGICLYTFVFVGEMFYYVLTCVERYLAVVHPITYMSLKSERVITIRNIGTGCLWLLSVAVTGLLGIDENVFFFLHFVMVFLAFIVVSFFSLSVLCVLIKPRPGEQGAGRERVVKSKQRAFYTILIMLALLVSKLVWDMIWATIYLSSENKSCTLIALNFWFNLPSSLVLPTLYVFKVGKTPFSAAKCAVDVQ